MIRSLPALLELSDLFHANGFSPEMAVMKPALFTDWDVTRETRDPEFDSQGGKNFHGGSSPTNANGDVIWVATNLN